MTTPRTLLLAAAAAAVTLTGATLPAAASARSHTCAPKTGTPAIDAHKTGRVWHQGTSLYACTTVYDHVPKAKRMGPWAAGTKVAFDGVNLAWTVPMKIEGRGTDRVWAANVDSGRRWMLAQKPNPGGATKPAREGRVQRLVVTDQAVAWVTKGGAVVGAFVEPADDPSPVGPLPSPPVVQQNLTLVGSFGDADPVALGKSLKLAEMSGDGDECGGVNEYVLTVRPDAAPASVGIQQSGYWQSTNCS